jgi:FtsZ-binding cell division protein ZapB
MEVFIMSAVWEAIKAIKLAKAKLGWGVGGLAKADYTPRAGEAMLAFDEAWAAYDLLRMELSEISEEDALAWQEAVGSKFKAILIELGAERREGRKPDIQAIRTLISQIKDIAEEWRGLLNEKWQVWVDQGRIKIPEITRRRGEVEEYLASVKNKMDEYLGGLVKYCNTFLEITADWVMGEPEDPKKAIPRILEEMGKKFESLRRLLGGHSPELIDAENAFKEWRDAIIGAVTGAKEVTKEEIKRKKDEIKRKKDNFIDHWQSFEGRMIDHNWFGSITAMKVAAAMGGLYHDLLDNLFKLGLL